MPDRHKQKILPNMVAGILLVTLGILLVFYTIYRDNELARSDKKMLIAVIIVAINAGLYFWGNAYVHKVKSDLIRKQRHRDHRDHDEEI